MSFVDIILGLLSLLLPVGIAIFLLSYVGRMVQVLEDIADAQQETTRLLTQLVAERVNSAPGVPNIQDAERP